MKIAILIAATLLLAGCVSYTTSEGYVDPVTGQFVPVHTRHFP